MLNKNFVPQRLDPGQEQTREFFDKEPEDLATALLGKVLRRKVTTSEGSFWLAARIIETEAYYITEKGSHSSLGFTEKRKAMFMSPGTLYMYYARGGDSLNFSALGSGNGVLVKSAYPHIDSTSPEATLDIMRSNNPGTREPRAREKLCNGQTLLCKSLNLKVPEWNQQQLKHNELRLEDINEKAGSIIKCRRIGIPEGRDHDLMLRFVEESYSRFCTSNPLTKRKWREGIDYRLLTPQSRRKAIS
jgi:DNA-3-methyladenine glycosylase